MCAELCRGAGRCFVCRGDFISLLLLSSRLCRFPRKQRECRITLVALFLVVVGLLFFPRGFAREEAERFVWQRRRRRRRPAFASPSLFDELRSASVLSESDHLCSLCCCVVAFFYFVLFLSCAPLSSQASVYAGAAAPGMKEFAGRRGSSSRELHLVTRQQAARLSA